MGRRDAGRGGAVALAVALSFALPGCGGTRYDRALPDSAQIGNPRGLRMARVIQHFHSPYSWDACDKKGLGADGITPDGTCMEHLRQALCENRVDYLFLTDHPDAMARFDFGTLLLPRTGDETVGPVNWGAPCADGFRPRLSAGFESKLLALGMNAHLAGTVDQRRELYDTESAVVRAQLQTDVGAVVAIPHPEGKTVAEIQALGPDAMEIYNIHANLDPKIRHNQLGWRPFEIVPKILSYLVDPYAGLEPDFVFFHFARVFDGYFDRWNAIVGSGTDLAGFAATDSHENVFPQKAADGERLDAHRRLMRYVSNHYAVADLSFTTVRTALKQGRGWVVFEGFGTPTGMDISGTVGGTTVGPGQSVALAGGSGTITVRVPRVFAGSPRTDPQSDDPDDLPQVRVQIRRAGAGGGSDLVAAGEGEGATVTATVSSAGAFRAELFIRPRHLRGFLKPYEDLADEEFRWIITNHVRFN